MPPKRDLYILSAATALLHLVCINQYGYFRDELYYLACGEHLAWGYVDQPPLIALVAWLERHLFGDSLLAVRIFAVLASAATVCLTGLFARRLGGSRFAQNFAALCAMIAPIYLATGHFLSMNAFEPLIWTSMAYTALAIFQGGDERLWLVFGALAGIGLENKHTTLFFGAAFAIGLLLSEQRRHLLRPWIWLGGVVAALVFLPNLLWEVQHQFATVELLNNVAHSNKNTPVTPWSFFTGQIFLMHPLTLPVWLAGIVWLIRQPRYRALGITFIALFALFVVMKGKIYYLNAAYPMVFAAGAIAIDGFLRQRGAGASPARGPRAGETPAPLLAYVVFVIFAVAGALVAPSTLPILPPETYIAYSRALHLDPPKSETHRAGPLPQHYADEFGWPEMTAAVARAYATLTPAERAKCAIFAQNYGQAAAIDFFGRQYGLPKAISGHQNYFLWGPRGATTDVMIVLDDDQQTLEEIFEDVRPAGLVHHPYAMPYESWEIHICRRPKVGMSELWPKVKKWI
jgi:hypothetical protein